MRCRTCGATLEAGANFCGECGSAVTITSPAIPANAQSRASSSRITSVVEVPSLRPIRPPPRAGVSVRYRPPPMRAQPRPAARRRPTYPKSRLLAAILEWLFPGIGLMYADGFWKGALVLLGTFIATGAALNAALSNAGGAQPEDVLNFIVWLFLAHLVWLLVRVIWAWRLAGRATRLSRLAS
jgi:hypothetical protein